MTLTTHQKKEVVKYLLAGVGKGLFEDCDEFWEGITQEEIDENFEAYRDAVDEFIDGLKEKILADLK